MKTMAVGSLKTNFSEVVDGLRRNEEYIITYGRKKEVVGKIIPKSKISPPSNSITPDFLRKKGYKYQMKNFEMSEKELLGK